MPVTNITMNLTALQGVTPPSLNVSTNASAVFGEIIQKANFYTNDYLILAVLVLVSVISYIVLSDRTQNGDFLYSDARALSLSFGIASIIGVTIIENGLSPNFVAVGLFTALFLVTYIFIITYENKE